MSASSGKDAAAGARRAEIEAMFGRHGPAYRAWATLTVMLGTFSAVMEATIVNIALPGIIRQFDLGHDEVQLLSTGFLAATTASMLLSHWASRRFGVRVTYRAAIAMLMLSSVLAAASSAFWQLALCRVAQGIVAGIIQPLAMATLVEVYPPQQRGRAMSAYGLGIVLSPAVGPVVGGLLVDHFGWRSVFLVTLPFCAAAWLLARTYLIRGRAVNGARQPGLDLPGLALLSLSLFALLGGLAALLRAPATAAAGIVSGLALAFAFVARQRRIPHPLLDLAILRHPGFAAAMWVTLAYGMGLYGSTYVAPLYAQDGAHFSAFEAGSMLVPGGILLALVLLASGRLADRRPPHQLAMAGLACFFLSALFIGLAADVPRFWLLAALVALGRVGLGMMIPGLNAGALRLLPSGGEMAGAAVVNFARQLGGAFGVTLLALFLEWRQHGPDGDAALAVQAYAESFYLIALLYALALFPARRMGRRGPIDHA